MASQNPPSSSIPTIIGTPLVSVIVPTYNRPGMLAGCLRSILHQTYPNVEIVVVNDGGTDIRKIIDPLNQQNKITSLEHHSNRGMAAARNTGIAAAKGKYIAYLDDDDSYLPHHIETLVSFLENSDCIVAYTDAHRAHIKTINGREAVKKRDVPYSFDFDSDRMLIQNYIPTLCVMHEKKCLDETGSFDEDLNVLEDWDLWIRMSRRYPFAHIRKITCEFAWRTDGKTMSSGRRTEFWRTVEIIYGKYRHLTEDKPRVRESQRIYLRNVRITSSLSRILGEQSVAFQWLLHVLTTAHNKYYFPPKY
jgi:glycosyltransferase involved in cell wall biosynthesis